MTTTLVSAQQVEPPASILIEYRDPATNRLIPSLGGLKTDQEVYATVKALDRFGKTIECTPRITPIQGVSGNQLIVRNLNDGRHLVRGGSGFGSAELQASCEEFPNHFSKEFVAVSRDLQPALRAAPQSSPAEPAATGSGSGAGTAIAVGAIAAGVGLVAVIAAAAAAGGSTSDNCPSYSDCCPGGGGGGCGAPEECSCPPGTTNQGICTTSGCAPFIGLGNRSCTCN